MDCGYLQIDFAEITRRTGTTYGNTTKAACKSGYAGGHAIFTCGASGNWEGNLVCSPIQCGDRIANVDPNAIVDCSGDTRYGGDPCIA